MFAQIILSMAVPTLYLKGYDDDSKLQKKCEHQKIHYYKGRNSMNADPQSNTN